MFKFAEEGYESPLRDFISKFKFRERASGGWLDLDEKTEKLFRDLNCKQLEDILYDGVTFKFEGFSLYTFLEGYATKIRSYPDLGGDVYELSNGEFIGVDHACGSWSQVWLITAAKGHGWYMVDSYGQPYDDEDFPTFYPFDSGLIESKKASGKEKAARRAKYLRTWI